jgi:hypothetical protein
MLLSHAEDQIVNAEDQIANEMFLRLTEYYSRNEE